MVPTVPDVASVNHLLVDFSGSCYTEVTSKESLTMPAVQRSSDVVESHSERAVMAGIGGIIVLAIGAVLFIFRGDGMLIGLALVLLIGGAAAVIYAIYCALQIRKVETFDIVCPYCNSTA
jgi:hypothetical protein